MKEFKSNIKGLKDVLKILKPYRNGYECSKYFKLTDGILHYTNTEFFMYLPRFFGGLADGIYDFDLNKAQFDKITEITNIGKLLFTPLKKSISTFLPISIEDLIYSLAREEWYMGVQYIHLLDTLRKYYPRFSHISFEKDRHLRLELEGRVILLIMPVEVSCRGVIEAG